MFFTTTFIAIALLTSAGVCNPVEPTSAVSVGGNGTAATILTPVAFEDVGPKANLTPKAAGGFSFTCWNIQLVGSGNGLSLAATCGNGNGGNNGWTYLPINNCFANIDGALKCKHNSRRSGNAMVNDSCDSCYLEADAHNRMDCRCFRINGSDNWSRAYLDDCITNHNGNLIC
ncbi:hypothetical protein AURDEDRAFT_124067 [Auricularia subglabra TFB-10046 SS5]|nr:hypothetical protein AURDEDRAFT_124067 [Auricularia subglabra TFB-10046 SS5]